MATVTYTVVRGDSLKKIASKYDTTISELVRINNIKNPNLIYVGQVLTISNAPDEGGESTPIPQTTNTTSKAIIEHFGLQADTDRTIFATWTWDKEHTLEYETKWYYDTGNDIWFIGSDSTAKDRQSIYNAPQNATRVRFVVRPVSETYKVNDQDTRYWVAGWSTEKIYSFSDNPPVAPPAPDVEIKDYTLTATLDNIDNLNATHIEFQVYNDNAHIFSSGIVKIVTFHAEYSCTVAAGSEYKVCCRALRDNLRSDWSPYSNNEQTKPAASSGITVCKAMSETSVYLEWEPVANATGYEIEYTTEQRYFDGSNEVTPVNGIEYNHYEITGLEQGDEYFFRVRATNDKGNSPWSGVKSIVIGKTPAAPTTWSSTTTGMVGDSLTLYWTHNAEDGSTQTYAEIEITVDEITTTHTITTIEEKDDEKTMFYKVDTSSYVEGSKIRWRVRTAGVTQTYGDWSVERTVDIYAPPTLVLKVTDSNAAVLETLEAFPFYISGVPGPNTQTPTNYSLAIVSNEAYETVDPSGNVKMVNAGQEVYYKNFDTSNDLLVEMSAGNVDLENNIRYTVRLIVSMNSGLTAEATSEFKVAWTDLLYEPNAEISIDKSNLTAAIRPYCRDENSELISGITLSVYRREFDGTFTELAKGLKNNGYTFITDPHPALDLARYRIVAITDVTGAVTYCDILGYPVGESSLVIQWDEAWTSFDTTNEDALSRHNWSGSLLKLPYNVDSTDNYKMDVSLVEYIGRKRPVSYYGTQLGESGTYNVEIERTDKETLHALRRLAIWTGDAYVRDPSGKGYWANVTVSFNIKHMAVTIPVTINVTRVEGGA